jgi:hypothetical protein
MHRIVVNCQTGEVAQVEYTAEEQAEYDAAIAAQMQPEPVVEPVIETPPIVEPEPAPASTEGA